MVINTALLNRILHLNLRKKLKFAGLGLLIHREIDMLSYFSEKKWFKQMLSNTSIKGVFTTKDFAPLVQETGIIPIICDDPVYVFYTLHNYLAKQRYRKIKTTIGKRCSIDKQAYVAKHNVIIGKGVVIEPNATILSDVVIGDNSVIRANAVIGTDGYEYKRSSMGVIEVFHDGKVIIGKKVTVGANTVIAKGFSFRDTIIGDESKIDNLVHIAHGVHIGKACFVVASCMIAGSVNIKDNVWIGPNASISNGITIEDNAYVTLGSVVTQDIWENERVTGNFAIPHNIFIANLKKSVK